MLIGDKYKIEGDSLNITLYQKGIPKNGGKIYWRPIAYFAYVKTALEHIANLEVNETGLKDLETVVKKQDEILKMIKELPTPLKTG